VELAIVIHHLVLLSSMDSLACLVRLALLPMGAEGEPIARHDVAAPVGPWGQCWRQPLPLKWCLSNDRRGHFC